MARSGALIASSSPMSIVPRQLGVLGFGNPTVTLSPSIAVVDFDPHPARGYGWPLRCLLEIRTQLECALSRLESGY